MRNYAQWADEVGLKVAVTGSAFVVMDQDTDEVVATVADVAQLGDVLGRREAELTEYAADWNLNTERIRPV